MKIFKQMTAYLVILAALIVCQAVGWEPPIRGLAPGLFHKHLADYDSERRRGQDSASGHWDGGLYCSLFVRGGHGQGANWEISV